ncbi:glutathione peroxidase [Pontibacter sp. KCTC 32443]|uniref:glutathione peroxidase n=1 Tax=Pontibacter TaxID=323449 RepID=UPI00164EC73F|nr:MULTISPECIES: glutathione peroxidase [Pontibacter]MBC5772455.1 glutathione peroxidase [Pontibacter sp. KCTC 32443]
MKKLVKLLALVPVLSMMVACSGNNNGNTASTDTTTSDKTMATETQTKQDFYNFKLTSLDGQEVDFSKYKGKKVLLVNTASECGYTPQYADLEQLHDTYGEKVVILGFPANNFGGQEPGSNEEIAAFCQKNYGVSFQMFEKISVKGEDQHPLYTWLSQNAPNQEEPNWNFCKYLVNEQGEVVAFFPSKVKPMSEEIVMAIQQ